ncbi:hypothetical protein PvNV_016 [Penaeus vannamei nudivirus]|nr:hypothetical protein PvSNPV_016 [Penaeus vannamei nucleopolyhedrovirus]
MEFEIDTSVNTVLVNNEFSYPIVENEFTHKGISYIIFNYTTTLVKHKKNSISELETKYFDVPMVMDKDKALELIKDIANIAQYQLSVNVTDANGVQTKLGSKDGLIETLDRIKNRITKEVKEQETEHATDENFQMIIKLIFSYLNHCEPKDLMKSLNAANVSQYNIYYAKGVTLSTILSELLKYISYHNTFNEVLIDKRGFSNYNDAAFVILVINTLMSATLPKIKGQLQLNTINDMLLHVLIEMMYSITTMRLDNEMFIKERNLEAAKIKNKYFARFPSLKSNNKTALQMLAQNTDFKEMIEKENIMLYPFILFYNQSDKDRITSCYDIFKDNKDSIKQFVGESELGTINWISSSKFYELLLDFTGKHTTDFSRYDTESFKELICTFIVQKPTLKSLEPTCEEMET